MSVAHHYANEYANEVPVMENTRLRRVYRVCLFIYLSTWSMREDFRLHNTAEIRLTLINCFLMFWWHLKRDTYLPSSTTFPLFYHISYVFYTGYDPIKDGFDPPWLLDSRISIFIVYDEISYFTICFEHQCNTMHEFWKAALINVLET